MRSNRENIVFFLLTLAGVIVSTAFFTSTTGQMQIRNLLARTNNTGGQLATPTTSTGRQINTPTSSTGGYAAVPTNQIDQKKIDDLTALANTYLEKGNGVIIGVQSFRNENENVYVLVFQPKGQMDEKGDTGAQGLMGDKGDAGVQGLKGDTGAKGDKGDTGTKGDTGDKGDKGDAGTKGDTSAIGSQGLKGDKAKADDLTAQVETLTTRLETAKADALKAETDAKAKADELTAQVETLTAQLATEKADAMTAETDAKAKADELTAQVETLTTQLATAKADALKAETDAKAKADELTEQIVSLTSEFNTAKDEFDGKATEQEKTFAQLKAKLTESEINRLELQRKVYALTVDANYRNNTVCTFGLHLRDIAPELTDKWYTVTPIDLSKNGTQSFELVGGNMWIIGQVNVTVDGDSVLVDQDIILEGIGRTKIQSEYLNIFNDLNSIKPEVLEGDGLDGMGYRFGEPISIEKDLGGDTNVLLYVRNVATFHTHVSPGRVLVRMGENLPDRIKRRNAMIEMMDPMMNEEVPTARGD